MAIMKDQYLKAHDLFDAENSRFWIRFNLFTGMQLIIIAGIASNYDKLIKEKFVCILLVLIVLAFSIFTILVMWRSFQISMAVYKAIKDLEDGDSRFILLKTYSKHCRSKMGTIVRYCIAMSVVLSFFWFLLLIKIILA